ncbi:MAG: heavy metal translocating P-type ATPase [Steroidobacteraceae bacterium]
MSSNTATLAAAPVAERPAASAAAACFHCGEMLPASPVSVSASGRPRQFCCTGCAAAAQWIQDARLEDYYRLRSDRGSRVTADDTDLAAWDQEDIIGPHARAVAGGREIVLLVDGMRCAACAWLIDRALAREPGVREVCANAVTGRIRLAWDPARGRLSQVLRRLLSLGYRPFLASDAARERARRAERRRMLLRVGLAGLASMQAMMFAEVLYLDAAAQMAPATRDFFRWITFLISTPVVFWSGWPFLTGAWREIRERALGMDTLIASSTLLAWGGSTFETLRGGPQVWYDAAVMFVFVLLVARMLEQRVRLIANDHVDRLAQAQPMLAVREADADRLETVPVMRLAIGDRLHVAAGETVPADGRLLDAPAAFIEALLTGESQPVAHAPGAAVFAGTFCPDAPVRIEVTATGSATRLSALAQMVQRAQETRPRIARLANRVATHFVLALAFIAAITALAWLRIDPSRAFEVTLALLVISCPCALSLSIPAATAAAQAALSRLGVLPARPDALDTLARVTDFVFDKTGTLGSGRWSVADTQLFADDDAGHALALAAALEAGVRHPLATAFADTAAAAPATQLRVIPGAGICGQVQGRMLRIGTAAFAAGRADDGAVWLGELGADGSQRAIARFALREETRPDAAAALAALRAAGIRLHLYSGDGEAAVQRFAAALALPAQNSAARLLPDDKLARVRALQAQGAVVAMVGDGLNDAPVLGGADVSIAMAEGASLARHAADLVMTQDSLQRIPQALQLARRMRRIVRENLALALAYNLVALPLAALGLVRPSLAAIAMVSSSLTVTLNALRLSRKIPQ